MRIRTIKPEFFKHDRMCEIPPFARLLFIGLWCLADCAGRLEDRPKRIKVEVLPYDDVDVDALLSALENAGQIVRYAAGGKQLIEIPSFLKHQRITGKEAEGVSGFPSAPQKPPEDKPRPAENVSGKQRGNNGEAPETTGKEWNGDTEGNKERIPPKPPSAPASPSLGVGRNAFLPTTPEALAIAALFRRRPTTAWAAKEVRVFKQIVGRGVLNSDVMRSIEVYYAAERAKGDHGPGKGHHRRDVMTFLNNFDGEVDRANAHAASHAPANEAWRAEWKPWLESKGHKPMEFATAPDFLKTDFWKDRKGAKK